MFPIRCLIEAVDDDQCPKCSDNGSLVVSDSYAIVAGQTPLSQLVDTVLAALGLQHLGFGCKPMLQLKNWKPLTFDQISDEPDIEVETLLKDVSNQLTLRILTKQSSTALQGSVNDLKDRLLRAILQKVPDLLSESQRSQWKEFLAQLALATSSPATVAQMNLADLILAQKSNSSVGNNSNNSWLDEWSKRLINHQGIIPSALSENDISSLTNSNKGVPNSDPTHRPTPAANDQQGVAPAITRFSPLLEIPKLEHWFRENANPSRHRLQQYVNILNASNFRKHTSKVTYQQMCNWFINARATSRRKASRTMSQRAAGQQDTSPQRTDTGPQATTNGLPQKVFGNQVRNLSLAFNSFINQSSPASPSTNHHHHNQNTSQDNDSAINDSSTLKNNVGTKNPLREDFEHQIEDDDQDQDDYEDDDDNNAINLSKNVVVENQLQNKHIDSIKSNSPLVGTPTVVANGGNVTDSGDAQKHFHKVSSIPTKNGSLAEISVDNGSHSDEQNSCSPNSLNNENPSATTPMTDHRRSPSVQGSTFQGFTPVKTSPINSVVAAHHYQHFPSSHLHGNAEPPFQQQQQQQVKCFLEYLMQVNVNRSRLMFDPLSELPMLEKWFEENPHPSWVQIDQITETLNNMPYRHTYPRVSSHNVKIWFKNRRAKSKRHLVASDAVKNEVDQKSIFRD